MAADKQSQRVSVNEHDHQFLQLISCDSHAWFADEPISAGGKNLGPAPHELLLSSLGACTAMTIRFVAKNKGYALDDVSVTLQHTVHGDGRESIERNIALTGELTFEEKDKLIAVANKCPVHKTLTGNLSIQTNQMDDL